MNQNSQNIQEVLITGAGPTGLMMACQLALFNIPFRIIDKKKSPATHSGALIIHARTMEIFKQMGIVDKVLEQGTVIKTLSVCFNGRKSLRLDLTDKANGLSDFPFMLMLEQFKTEQLLVEFLQEKGHLVEWETELVDVVPQEHEVETLLLLPDGSREKLKTAYLIAADGGKSRIRTRLNIPFEGKTHPTKLAIMECDTDMTQAAGEILFTFSKQATTGFFPLPEGTWRIDAALRNMQGKKHRLTFDKVQQVFNHKTRLNANVRNSRWFSVFHSHGKCAETYRMNRCYLVGDAAHLFTPVGGEGMNTGLQDAYNLAWKLAFVIQKKAVPQILDTYEEERRCVAIKTCRSSDRFFELAASGKIWYVFFRKYLLPPILHVFFRSLKQKKAAGFVFKRLSGVGIAYARNTINRNAARRIYRAAPRPGQRFPFIQYPEKGNVAAIQEKEGSTRFHLFIFGDRSHSDILLKAVRKYRELIVAHVIPFTPDTSDLYLQFGIKSEGWYLVRPDMYIACRSDEPGAEELKAYLHTLFIRND